MPKTISIPLTLKAGKRTIKFEFTNDYYVAAKDGKPAEDRNLYLFDLKLTGRKQSGRLDPEKRTPIHKAIVIAEPSPTVKVDEAIRKVFQPLASRAFRRPVLKEELDRLVGLMSRAIEEGDSYEAALQLGLQALLVFSPFSIQG